MENLHGKLPPQVQQPTYTPEQWGIIAATKILGNLPTVTSVEPCSSSVEPVLRPNLIVKYSATNPIGETEARRALIAVKPNYAEVTAATNRIARELGIPLVSIHRQLVVFRWGVINGVTPNRNTLVDLGLLDNSTTLEDIQRDLERLVKVIKEDDCVESIRKREKPKTGPSTPDILDVDIKFPDEEKRSITVIVAKNTFEAQRLTSRIKRANPEATGTTTKYRQFMAENGILVINSSDTEEKLWDEWDKKTDRIFKAHHEGKENDRDREFLLQWATSFQRF